jgi:hypothetical protein
VDLDRDEKAEGTDKAMVESWLGYAGSIGTALWNEIEENRSKVRLDLDGLDLELTLSLR